MKVYQLNDCDWYAGADMESAIQCALEMTGIDRSDYLDERLHELTDGEMNRLKISFDETREYQDGECLTFRQALNKMVEDGATFPCFFASTEY